MFILVLGVFLWWAAHLFKRISPAKHAQLGAQARGRVAISLLISVVLMIIGYRMADVVPLGWGPTPMLKGINNLLILIAFYLFAASGMKTKVVAKLRHPQLIGFSLWAFAHLLVNGDVASVVLFGGLLAWALVEIVMINRAEPNWVPPAGPFPAKKEIRPILGAVVVVGVVGLIHTWLGYNPFGA